jgi:hypothetical protein
MEKTTDSTAFHVPPGEADRGAKLLQAAWSAIELQELRRISQNEISRYLGIAPSTFLNWTLGVTDAHLLEAALRLMERLPAERRHELIDRFLRAYPTIGSPELTGDPATSGRLCRLLQQRRGLTLIQGQDVAARTFLFSALGHSFAQRKPRKSVLVGADTQAPDWFVPVTGLTYVPPGSPPEAAAQACPRARPRPGSWVMLHGLWSALARRHKEILGWATDCHVVLAEPSLCLPSRLGRLRIRGGVPPRLLQVSWREPGRLRVDFHQA